MTFYDQYKKDTNAFIEFDSVDPMDIVKKEYRDCSQCENNKKIFGYGAYSPQIAFIGLEPSQYELDNEKIFSDNPNLKIHGIIEYLSRFINVKNNVYFTNLSLCLGGKPELCRERLVQEMRVVNPKYIVLLGEEVANQLGCEFRTLNTVNLDKYYTTFVTHSLKELFYDSNTFKPVLKEELDFIVREIENG